eukprot:jgi/Mesvir1/7856/Mv11790-RA.1
MGAGNGKLSESQFTRMTSDVFFKKVDKDGNNTIDVHEMYDAVLMVYNELNKRLTHAPQMPPSRAAVEEMMKKCDIDQNGKLDRREFQAFIRHFVNDFFARITRSVIIWGISTPAVAIAVKKAAEQVPALKPVFEKIPISLLGPIAAASGTFAGGLRL